MKVTLVYTDIALDAKLRAVYTVTLGVYISGSCSQSISNRYSP